MDYTHIKRLAQKQGITLKTLAEAIGISEQGFHGYIKKNTIPIDKLEMIALELNVHLVELLGEPEPQNNEILELLRENRELRKEIESLRKNTNSLKNSSKDDDSSINKPQLKPKHHE